MENLNLINDLNRRPTLIEAYQAGRDCAVFGADTRNCDFRYFSSQDLTQEWERGNRDGNAAKMKAKVTP